MDLINKAVPMIFKNRFHIFLWLMMIMYFVFSPKIYTVLILNHGKPVDVLVNEITYPHIKGVKMDVAFREVIVDGMNLYEFYGWAFWDNPSVITLDQYDRQIVLISKSRNYIFDTSPRMSPHLNEKFEAVDIDLTNAGFSALVAKDTIDQDVYHLGIIFRDNVSGKGYVVELTKTFFTRTPNQLLAGRH